MQMTADTSFLSYILNASFVVKCVMLILFFASITSWTIIVERWKFYKKQWAITKAFENTFWSGKPMPELYHEIASEEESCIGLPKVFTSGYQAFSKFQSIPNHDPNSVMDNAQRAMQIAENDMLDKLEQPLTLLMTIGSISPFIGLFGTVWGIMIAFQALGTVQQASIAMVAPGISEALITTALGLFTAIPAAVAYNRFTQQVNRLISRTEMFSGELANILQRAVMKG
jgi:biopolymer transport protein TolQ